MADALKAWQLACWLPPARRWNCGSSSSSPTRSSGRHAKQAGGGAGAAATAQAWLRMARARAQLWAALCAWLAHAALAALLWLGRLLLVPLHAVLGPWYRYNRHLKAEAAAALAKPYDLAALQRMLGSLPSWLSGIGGATESLAWLNTLLAQSWPVLDPVVCELTRNTIEPLLDDLKPPFIAKMGFQKLTLGELPVVLDGIRVVGTGDKQGVTHVEATLPGDASAAQTAAATAAAATRDDRLELEVCCHEAWLPPTRQRAASRCAPASLSAVSVPRGRHHLSAVCCLQVLCVASNGRCVRNTLTNGTVSTLTSSAGGQPDRHTPQTTHPPTRLSPGRHPLPA